jgi:hypothetical protein
LTAVICVTGGALRTYYKVHAIMMIGRSGRSSARATDRTRREMTMKTHEAKKATKKPARREDDLVKTTKTHKAELSDKELGRVSGGAVDYFMKIE